MHQETFSFLLYCQPWSIYRRLPSSHILLLKITCRIFFSSASADLLDDLVLFQITVIFLKEEYYLPVVIIIILSSVSGLLALTVIIIILFQVSSTHVKYQSTERFS